MTSTTDFEELEFAGAMAVRYVVMDITDYDAGGETFTENEAGMSRVQHANPEVIDGSGYVPQWDETTGTIKLFESAGANGEMAEAAAGATAQVRIQTFGRQ